MIYQLYFVLQIERISHYYTQWMFWSTGKKSIIKSVHKKINAVSIPALPSNQLESKLKSLYAFNYVYAK